MTNFEEAISILLICVALSYSLKLPRENEEQLAKPVVPSDRATGKQVPVKKPDLVKRPDHLDAVRIERDGHLNKNFRKEIMLGANPKANPIDKPSNKIPYDVELGDPDGELIAVYRKADINADLFLSKNELTRWIQMMTEKHLDEAVNENVVAFKAVDQNNDGFATWDEFHYHFLVDNKIMNDQMAKNHPESHSDLDPEKQEQIDNDLNDWKEADNEPKDGRLSVDEFLAFRHPEHSQVSLVSMVKDIMLSLDKDGDGVISEKEFARPPAGVAEPPGESDSPTERAKEFREAIDLDKNGVVTLQEMIAYTDPRHNQHSRLEAGELIELADSDKDGRLTLQEVLSHKSIFLGSGMLNPAGGAHLEL